MFKDENNGTSLRNHLMQDNFFAYNDTLTIIDDYNIVDIKEDATQFYIESFRDTGVRNIKIYFQIKHVKEERKREIRNIADKFNFNFNKLLTLCAFLVKGFFPYG